MISLLTRRATPVVVEKVRILGRNFATQTTTIDNSNDVKGGGGMGYGNVQKQHIPSVESENLYRLVTSSPKTVSIIGAPMTYGQPFVGTDSSPALIREHGLVRDLDKLGWHVDDTGDIDFVTICEQQQYQSSSSSVQINAKNCQKIGSGTKALSNIVESKLKLGHFPLILGGDHSIAVGSLAGILRAKPDTGVIWVDAHADLNTPASSESGNMHGMPLAIMMKELVPDRRNIPGFEWLEEGSTGVPFLSPKSLVYVGLRDIDKAERQFIRQLGIKIFTMYDIDHLGIGRVMDLALDHLLKNNPNRPIHLSYDIDAVDPIHAPATGTAVRGGLTWREAHFVAEHVVKSGNLASAEIVEVNATLSDGQGASVTVELGHQLVNALLGEAML
jgi:arginase